MHRLLRILTSRWTEAVVVALMILTAYTRNRTLWFVSCAAVAAVAGAIFVSCVPAFKSGKIRKENDKIKTQ